jgi:hypothetical protein
MVIKLELEPCTDAKPERATRELQKLVMAARRRIVTRREVPKFPMPIAAFLVDCAPIIVEWWICFRFCFFGLAVCTTCCYGEHRGGGIYIFVLLRLRTPQIPTPVNSGLRTIFCL